MTTNGTLGYGTTLSGATTGSIAEIVSIEIDGMEADEVDVTTMDSTNGWKEFLAGLKDAGSMTLTLVFEAANYAKILAAFAGTAEAWTITLPEGSTFVCTGWIKSAGNMSVPVEGRIENTATLRWSGEPTFTAGSGS